MPSARRFPASQSRLVEEWKSLITEVQRAALGIFATANVQITEHGWKKRSASNFAPSFGRKTDCHDGRSGALNH
jgi:hypothetical protein